MADHVTSNALPEVLERLQEALRVASRMSCAVGDLVERIEDDIPFQYGVVCAIKACIETLERAVHPALDEVDELVKPAEVNHG